MALGSLALTLGCGERLTATEHWSSAPAIRLAVIAAGGVPSVRLLDAGAPIELPLGEAFDRGERVSVWILGYSLETLSTHLPALAEHTPSEIARLVQPLIGESEGTAPLPQADEILCSDLTETSPTEIEHRRCDWQEWRRAGISVALRLPPEVACGATSLDRFEAPAGFVGLGIAAVSATVALVAGTDATTGPAELRLLRLDDDHLTPLGVLSAPTPLSGRLSWDPLSRSLFGVGRSGDLFRVDLEGRPLPVPSLPLSTGVWAARDGTVLAEAYYLHELIGSAWVERRPVENQLRAITMVRGVNRGRIFYLNACWIQGLSLLPNAPAPTEIFLDSSDCVEDRGKRIREIAADEDGLIVVGVQNRISMRADPSGELREDSGALGRADLNAAASLGRGRHLVGGDAGALAFWTGREWCPLTGDPTLTTLAASTPGDQRTAFVLVQSDAGQPTARTLILRARVPLPAAPGG